MEPGTMCVICGDCHPAFLGLLCTIVEGPITRGGKTLDGELVPPHPGYLVDLARPVGGEKRAHVYTNYLRKIAGPKGRTVWTVDVPKGVLNGHR